MRCRSTFAFAFLSSLLLLVASPLLAAWQFLPAGQPYLFDFVSDSSGQRLLTSTETAGAWSSADGGHSWDQLCDRDVPNWVFQVLDARSDTILALGSGTGYPSLISTDGGTTWEERAAPPIEHPQQFGVWHAGHNVWFRITSYPNRWFYRSTDFGRTWPDSSSLDIGYPQQWDGLLYQDPLLDSTIYALPEPNEYQSGISILQSRDLGRTWRSQLWRDNNDTPLYPAQIRQFMRLSAGPLVAIIYVDPEIGPGYYAVESTDGISWSEIPSWNQFGTPEQVLEDRFHPGRLFLLTSAPFRLLKSNDNGQTWYDLAPNLPERVTSGSELRQNQFSGRLYLNTDLGYAVSENAGESWSGIESPPVGASRLQFDVTPQALFAKRLWDQGPAFELTTPYDYWRPLTGIKTHELFNDTIFEVSRLLSKSGDSLTLYLTQVISDSLEQVTGHMVRSFDDGASWTIDPALPRALDYSNLQSYRIPSGVRFLAHRNYWEGVVPDTLFASGDLGLTWRSLWPLPENQEACMVSQFGNTIVLVTAQSEPRQQRAFRSTDDGRTWNQLGSAETTGDLTPYFCGSELLVLSNNQLRVWADSVWTVRSELPPGADPDHTTWSIAPVDIHPPLLIARRSDSDSLYVSADTGRTWQWRFYELPFVARCTHLDGLTYDPYRHRLWASTGVGSVYLDISELAVTDEHVTLHPSSFILSVFPNPFNSESRILFDLDKRSHVKLDLFNIEGRLVRTITDDILDGGHHELNFSGSDLSSGIYFLRLNTPQRTRTEKIVLLK